MYPRFSCLVPLDYLLSQALSCVSVFLGLSVLECTLVFLFGPFSLLTFTGCVLCVRVSVLSVLECTLGFPVWSFSLLTFTGCVLCVRVSVLSFLNVPSVFLFGPFSLLTFTGCVMRVRVSGLSVLECTLGFPVWSL